MTTEELIDTLREAEKQDHGNFALTLLLTLSRERLQELLEKANA